MFELASFAIAVITLLVAVTAFMLGDSNRNQSLRYGMGVFFLTLTVVFVLIGTFSLLGNTFPSVTVTPPLEIPPRETGLARFEVQAAVQKNRTGLSVAAGDIIRIEYLDGQWTGDSSQPGRTEGCGFAWHDPDPNRVWLFPPEQRGAALVGYIDSEPFFIGCRPVEITAARSGELFLGMSDCLGCYWDNVGQLYVSVSVRKR
jgi:hypothetical protein